MVVLTLSVGRVAGLESPALLVLFVVSISSGTNFLLGLGVVSERDSREIDTGVVSGVGRGLGCLLLLKVVSTGSGTNRRLGAAKSFFSTPSSFAFASFTSFLLLRVVVSVGSTANRRTLFAVVSIGVGEKRLEVGGGDCSDIIVVPLGDNGQLLLPRFRIL